LIGQFTGGDRGRQHVAHDLDRRDGVDGQLAQLAVLHEQQEPEQRRVFIVGAAKLADHRRHFRVGGALAIRQRPELPGERHVVPLEERPHQLLFAGKVAIQGPF